MKILQSKYCWFFCFTVMFLLSLDFWSWGGGISFSLFHLPSWVFYFIGLQIMLSLALLIFTLHFWVTPSKESDN